MKNTILTLIIILSFAHHSHAQYYTNRNKVWVFGLRAGLDFTSGSPVFFASKFGNGEAVEGTASVCDTNGHLLFYTNGTKVFNRAHAVLPSGSAVVPFPTYSTSQAAVIVPAIGNPDRYYLFSLQHETLPQTGRLAYTIIDMTLDGGYGAPVPGSIGITLYDSLSERMIAIPGTHNDVWLLTHRYKDKLFVAFNITAAGINPTPTISNDGCPGPLTCAGIMKASHNKKKLAVQSLAAGGNPCSLLYDFDPATGIVSGRIALNSVKGHYGAEFSPDNTKLYTQHSNSYDTIGIFQYDISLASASAIRASETLVTVFPSRLFSDLKLGPDSKIYFAGRDDSTMSLSLAYSRYLDCISAPNNVGAACGHISQVIKLPDTCAMLLGLPNVIVEKDTVATPTNTTLIDLDDSLCFFPNPAVAELTITSPVTITAITITNFLGQPVLRQACSSQVVKVDISTLPPSLYFVTVNDAMTKKLVKL